MTKIGVKTTPYKIENKHIKKHKYTFKNKPTQVLMCYPPPSPHRKSNFIIKLTNPAEIRSLCPWVGEYTLISDITHPTVPMIVSPPAD